MAIIGTSPQWLSPDLVSISKWSHYLVIVIPKDRDPHNKVMMYVTGESNDNTPPSLANEELLLAAGLAQKAILVQCYFKFLMNRLCLRMIRN